MYACIWHFLKRRNIKAMLGSTLKSVPSNLILTTALQRASASIRDKDKLFLRRLSGSTELCYFSPKPGTFTLEF